MRKEKIQGLLLLLGFGASAVLLFLPDSAELYVRAMEPAGPALSSQKEKQKVPERKVSERRVNNPLFAEYKRRGRELNLNMDFTGIVRTLVPYDRRLNHDSLELELFCAKEKSLDVLLIGDSTMAWGVIPSVVEQRSGLRVGMFAMRSMYLNATSMRTAERLQKYYLKEGGITLFGFAIWTQLQDPEIVRRGELLKFSRYSDEEFERFARDRRSSCNVTNETVENQRPRIFSRGSLDSYSAELGLLRRELRQAVGGLRESTAARRFREWAHPAWFNARMEPAQKEVPAETAGAGSGKEQSWDAESNEFGDYRERISLGGFQFVRWDRQTLTATGPFPLRSIPSTAPADPRFEISEDQRTNAQSLIRLPGRKGFIITFYPEHRSYVVQRSIYAKLYKEHLELVDLGEMHPPGRGFSMDNEGHPANLGGLEKSLLIAEWLRDNFRSQM